MTGHPGGDLRDAVEPGVCRRSSRQFREQVQDFTRPHDPFDLMLSTQAAIGHRRSRPGAQRERAAGPPGMASPPPPPRRAEPSIPHPPLSSRSGRLDICDAATGWLVRPAARPEQRPPASPKGRRGECLPLNRSGGLPRKTSPTPAMRRIGLPQYPNMVSPTVKVAVDPCSMIGRLRDVPEACKFLGGEIAADGLRRC